MWYVGVVKVVRLVVRVKKQARDMFLMPRGGTDVKILGVVIPC